MLHTEKLGVGLHIELLGNTLDLFLCTISVPFVICIWNIFYVTMPKL